MRLVSIDQVEEKTVLGRTVYVRGRAFLRDGVTLSRRMAERLRGLGIAAVYVRDRIDDAFPDMQPAEVIPEQTRQETVGVVRRTFEGVKKGSELDSGAINKAVTSIVDEILGNSDVMVELARIRSNDDALFDHSVSVCTLAIQLAVHYGLRLAELRSLAIGALLHDIGKVFIPNKILLSTAQLTPEEEEELENHTRYGFELLRKVPGLSILAAHVAYQHHEQRDGSGYPRGLMGDDIHRYARIVRVANTFDALTSQQGTGAGVPFHEALLEIQSLAGSDLDEEVVRVFLSRVAAYPVGTCVKLNTGELAVVVRQVKGSSSRPIVHVVHGEKVNLSEERGFRIVEVVDAGLIRRMLKDAG